MRVTEETIARIKEENDIVDIVSERVRLKKSGRNYTGLCPFHSEKTPSFVVSQDKQIFKCFGCGEAGNAISFVMKTRNLNFNESLKLLAERANIQLEEDESNNEVENKKQKLYKINVEAARYFHDNLVKNDKAKQYLFNRGINVKTIRKFGLGFALDSWNSLLNHLKSKGYTELDLLDAGLITKNEQGRIYDKFRNRVMFPVFNISGKVIGFGGRVLDDSKPKYLNSPETLVFHKGSNLYGINYVAKESKENSILLVEGYMDLISLKQAGIDNVVACLGTALTSGQGKLIKRFGEKIILSYDSDEAGQKATERAIEVLKDMDMIINILHIPQGKDPDEYVKLYGKDAFLNLCSSSVSHIEYRLERAKIGLNLHKTDDIVKYSNIAREILKDCNPVEKELYIKRLSEQLKVSEESLTKMLNNGENLNYNSMQNLNNYGDYSEKLYIEPAYLKCQRYLLALSLQDEESYNFIKYNLNEDELINECFISLFNLIKQGRDNNIKDLKSYVETRCNDDIMIGEWVQICSIEIIEQNNKDAVIEGYISELKRYKLEKMKKQIKQKIKEYEAKGMILESLQEAKKLNELQKGKTRG